MICERALAETIACDLKIKQTRVNGFTVNYVVASPSVGMGEKGRSLILLHGLNIGWGQWYKNIAALAKDFRVYALDLPGSGGSTKFDVGLSDFENDIVLTIEKFIERMGLDRTSVVGHSVGGWVALRLALRGNVIIDKIVLADPLGMTDHVPLRHMPVTFALLAEFLARTVVSPSKKNMSDFLTSVCRNRGSIGKIFSDYYHESVHRGRLSHPFDFMNRLFRPFGLRREFVLINELNRIMNDILVISGSHDFLVPKKKLGRVMNSLKNGRMVVMQNTGHVPFMESPHEWNKVVLEFLLSNVKK